MPLITSEHYNKNRFDFVQILKESQGPHFGNHWYITAVRQMDSQTDTNTKLGARKLAVFHSLHCTEKCTLDSLPGEFGVKNKNMHTLVAGNLHVHVHTVLWALAKVDQSHKILHLPLSHCSRFQALDVTK